MTMALAVQVASLRDLAAATFARAEGSRDPAVQAALLRAAARWHRLASDMQADAREDGYAGRRSAASAPFPAVSAV
ncbi:hypothetical protein ACE7GA_05410 [Roseomonas sp. CCTCC AB2023176]|uniref:hypothetical protein n=1 Tax=Roseomonas sp. CCTCC AB2023176 TaxID=3342640 RepID=UPI0035E09795